MYLSLMLLDGITLYYLNVLLLVDSILFIALGYQKLIQFQELLSYLFGG